MLTPMSQDHVLRRENPDFHSASASRSLLKVHPRSKKFLIHAPELHDEGGMAECKSVSKGQMGARAKVGSRDLVSGETSADLNLVCN